MKVLDTSLHSKEESLNYLARELEEHPLLVLTGPQGGGKTTLGIELLSDNVGAMFEGRARSAQPVVLVRRDLASKLKEKVYETRKLPIFEGDEPVCVDVTYYEQLKLLIENVFDVMELGEEELVRQITRLLEPFEVKPRVIELVASEEELIRRRLSRHLDAVSRLEKLLEKEKKYNIESNILGIQGAKVADPLKREGVEKYRHDQISRTIEDFDRIIPTKGMTVKECLEKMIEICANENREAGFLVLHTDEGEKIVSDLVVGRQENSLIGVTLLEIYVGYRQCRSLYRAYKHALDGKLEVIHSYNPTLEEMECLANPLVPPEEDYGSILSTADQAASERFDIIVSVVDPEGNVESSSRKRKRQLEEMLFQPQQQEPGM